MNRPSRRLPSIALPPMWALRQGLAWLARLRTGVLLAAAVALAASMVAHLHGGPPLLYALLFGVACHDIGDGGRTRPGIDACARTVLRLGVGLLGARITLGQIQALGWGTAIVVVVAVASTLLLARLLARPLGLTPAQGVLCGGAVAICGASAALAIAAVLPRHAGPGQPPGEPPHGERFTLLVVVTVTALSTVAMLLYPLIARGLQLAPPAAGLFIGATIHDVAQVVGAGYLLGPQVGDLATIVKLFRVALLTVVVLGVSLWARRAHRGSGAPAGGLPPLVPAFLWLFVALVGLNSAGLLDAGWRDGLQQVSRACLVLAIAALGLKTSIGQLVAAGWRPVLLLVLVSAWLAGGVLGALRWL